MNIPLHRILRDPGSLQLMRDDPCPHVLRWWPGLQPSHLPSRQQDEKRNKDKRDSCLLRHSGEFQCNIWLYFLFFWPYPVACGILAPWPGIEPTPPAREDRVLITTDCQGSPWLHLNRQLVLNCGKGNGTPLQYSCLENPMDGGAWWAAVHGVAKSQTRLSNFPFTFHFHALEKEMATHSSVFAWRIPGTGEPGGRPSMGSHRVGHDWSDLAAAAAVATAAVLNCTPCCKGGWEFFHPPGKNTFAWKSGTQALEEESILGETPITSAADAQCSLQGCLYWGSPP